MLRRVGKQIVIVGKRGQSNKEIADHLTRLSLRQKGLMTGIVNMAAKAGGTSRGTMMDLLRARAKLSPAGTIAHGKKGVKVYLSRNLVSNKKHPFRDVAHHELFHANVPVLGQSEILAHLYGGLRAKKGKLSPGQAVKDLDHLINGRPVRALGEIGVAAGGTRLLLEGAGAAHKRLKGKDD